MTYQTPTREPDRLAPGTTWTWRRDDLTDFPAGAGWSLAYAFASATAAFAIAGGQVTADGNSFVVSVPPATTAPFVPGSYAWSATVSDGSGNKFEVDRGTLIVLPTLATNSDPRSHARRVLDTVEALIEGRASRSDMRYEIVVNGSMRRMDSFPHTELMALRVAYRAEVKAEEERDRVAQGRGGRRRVFQRFTRPNGGGNAPFDRWPVR